MDEDEQMEFFYDIFDPSLPRLGPGDDASTRKALDVISTAVQEGDGSRGRWTPSILDLGCGNGAQTVQLALNTEGSILAVDNHEPYLDELKRRAVMNGVETEVQICMRDMRKLQLEDESFDLVWSEGALFVVGFRDGLELCHALLAPGGFLAVTELCWLRADAPAECREFFESAYPAMVGVEQNLDEINGCGFRILEHFVLPESEWR